MYDPREKKLAEVLTGYSLKVEKNDNVLIEAFDVPDSFVIQLVRAVRALGGRPFVTLKKALVNRELIMGSSDEQMELTGIFETERMKKMQCYIGVRGSNNITENSDIPPGDQKRFEKLWLTPAHFKVRVNDTRWVILRYPSPSMAQQAGMSTEAFEDFYFNVCTLDYSKMSRAMDPLSALMEKTDKVHIKGPGTDLSFSIKGLPAIKCDGDSNIPDGEVFSAPVKDSVNGVIQYNTETLYQGTVFSNIRLTFENGRIVDFDGNHREKLAAIFDTDEGARYVGEFAIGLNPYVTKAMKDILFDEKIAGSFHFTPGNSYDDCDNGNKSSIHWDLVCIQTPEYGGGEIWFDDVLIRKDGLFVLPELESLNPEALK